MHTPPTPNPHQTRAHSSWPKSGPTPTPQARSSWPKSLPHAHPTLAKPTSNTPNTPADQSQHPHPKHTPPKLTNISTPPPEPNPQQTQHLPRIAPQAHPGWSKPLPHVSQTYTKHKHIPADQNPCPKLAKPTPNTSTPQLTKTPR